MKKHENKKGFTLIEVILAVALLGILSIATSSILVTCMKFLQSASAITKGTNAAAGQIENWKAGDNEKITNSSGTFSIDFPSDHFTRSGTYITGKDEDAENPIKIFDPSDFIIQPTNEIIGCRDALTINKSITSSQISTINARNVFVNDSSTISGGTGTNHLYSDNSTLPSGFTNYLLYGNYNKVISPVPIANVTNSVNYSGVDKSFDVTNEDKYFDVNNFNIYQSGTITISNNNPATDKTHKNLYIFIKGEFNIGYYYSQLTIKIIGTGKDYTGVYFIYCGETPSYVYNINCLNRGVFIYAPTSEVFLAATGLSGIIAENITVNGTSSFKPVTVSDQPSWQDIIIKLNGS